MEKKSNAPAAGAGGEDGIIASRREKARAVRDAGRNPFANEVEAQDRALVIELRTRFETALSEPAEALRYDPAAVEKIASGERVTVLGRLTARRGFGKVSFLNLRDATGDIQLFAKKDVLGDGFAVFDELDVGDHVQARGVVMVTKTGELSIQVDVLELVTKAFRPLPEKWHGMTDTDLRYRQRYVDLVANPGAAAVLRARSAIVQGLRDFLDARRFVEVETPTLHSLIGGAAAKPFTTHHNALDLDLFMRIAPELYLKRLVVGGVERVYEIGRCYRNEGLSTRHNPEFTMLEFYQAYATYEDLMNMTEGMLRHVDVFLERRMQELGLAVAYREWKASRSFTFDEPFRRIPMAEAISRALEVAEIPTSAAGRFAEVAVATDSPPGGTEEGRALVGDWAKRSKRARQVDWTNFRKGLGVCDSEGERTFVAYEYLAEPFLSVDYRSDSGEKSIPVFIIDYPAEVSPLARRKDSDPSLTDRFELFVEGQELCNAFSELNDPDDQAERFRDQVAKKSRGAEETMDYDEDYIRALEHGMPPAAGFGLGVDRLVMQLCVQTSIREVIAFPLLRPEAPR